MNIICNILMDPPPLTWTLKEHFVRGGVQGGTIPLALYKAVESLRPRKTVKVDDETCEWVKWFGVHDVTECLARMFLEEEPSQEDEGALSLVVHSQEPVASPRFRDPLPRVRSVLVLLGRSDPSPCEYALVIFEPAADFQTFDLLLKGSFPLKIQFNPIHFSPVSADSQLLSLLLRRSGLPLLSDRPIILPFSDSFSISDSSSSALMRRRKSFIAL